MADIHEMINEILEEMHDEFCGFEGMKAKAVVEEMCRRLIEYVHPEAGMKVRAVKDSSGLRFCGLSTIRAEQEEEPGEEEPGDDCDYFVTGRGKMH